ncbi:hypothetical protein STRCI_008351 [Streptomyces cinnabarinus]|uniref:Alpha/beta hydrolase n=1 Tax=Streptomyces cinnabarinus TaxID=67287 RepID=A0ABY7KSW9_9ACTN|nr:hypothetical protein [Streptomyces cinnabarinus]WAZ26725.1 hypothetical protein STRCI_008351 [Streptomyces cinnabarinus]
MYRAFLGAALCAAPSRLNLVTPYWGSSAAHFAWRHASLPRDSSAESFGGVDGLVAEAMGAHDLTDTHADAPLTALARESLADAIDLLWAVGMDDADEPDASVLAGLAVPAMELDDGRAGRTTADMDDDELLEWLLGAAPTTRARAGSEPVSRPVERFGTSHAPQERRALWRLQEAVSRIGYSVARGGSTAAVALWRNSWHARSSVFLGDVLTYLRQREQAGADAPIAELIGSALAEGAALRSADDPALVVVAHSMGGNIVYDLLSHLRPDLACDALVTVGSQVGVFAELGLLPAVAAPGDPSVERVPALPNVGHWINVYDPDDPLAFVTSKIFEGSEDFRYSTGRGLRASHSAYLRRPSFHHRLAERLRACHLPTADVAAGTLQE